MKRTPLIAFAGLAAVLLAAAAALTHAVTPIRSISASGCIAYDGMPHGFGKGMQAGMVHVPEGSIQLGSRSGYPDETPTGERIRVPARGWTELR